MRNFLLYLLMPKDHLIVPMDMFEEDLDCVPEYSIGFINFNNEGK